MRTRRHWQSRAIPVAVHGDEVPVLGKGKCWCKSSLNFAWYGLLAFVSTGLTTADYVFWIWGAFDAYLEADGSQDTVDEFLKILCWSLLALYTGNWPQTDHRGIEHLTCYYSAWLFCFVDNSFSYFSYAAKPICLYRYLSGTREANLAGSHLADGFFAVLWCIAGDMDYFAKTLSLPRWSLAVGCCALCQCTKNGPHTWQDNRVNAPWTQTLWTALAWRTYANRSRNRLFSLPGVTGLTVALDYMHCKYLGSDQYLLLLLPLSMRFFFWGGIFANSCPFYFWHLPLFSLTTH